MRAKSRRGSIGETWWSRTFVDVLEQSSIGGRLARGKTYARQGHVLTMAIRPGEVTASVQGSEPKPYDVLLTLARFSPEDTHELTRAIARVPFLVAGLAAGTLPEDLNALAERLELRLLPHGPADIQFSCTCPDWGEPCKHASAVTYLLAEHLDTDPFDLLTLHGVDRDQLIADVVEASELMSSAGADTGPAHGRAQTARPRRKDRADGERSGGGGLPELAVDDVGPAAVPGLAAPDQPGAAPSDVLDEATQAARYFRAAGPLPEPGGGTEPGSALDVLNHRLITSRGPSIAFWLEPHYRALMNRP